MRPRPALLALLCVGAATAGFPKNATLHLGNLAVNGSSLRVPVLIDVFQNDTLIAASDFPCAKETGCWLESDYLTGSYRNNSFVYRVAHAPMNVADYQFNNSCPFFYLVNGTGAFGSVLGFAADSPFLAYYHDQNLRLGYEIKMRVGPENSLYFVKEIAGHSIELQALDYPAEVSSVPPSAWNEEAVVFCVRPLFDYFQNSKSWLGVSKSLYPQWKQLAALTEDPSRMSLTISLMGPDQVLIGNLTVPGSSLIGANGNLQVSTFDGAAWDNCDVVTGTYLLKFLNYSVYYQEAGTDGFTLKHLMWDNTFRVEHSRFTLWNVAVVVVLLAIFAGVCYYGYKYYFWQGAEGRVSEEYRSLMEPMELREAGAPSKS